MEVPRACVVAPAWRPSDGSHFWELAARSLVLFPITIAGRAKDTKIVALLVLAILINDSIGVTIDVAIVLRARMHTPAGARTVATTASFVDFLGTVVHSNLCLVVVGTKVAHMILHPIEVIVIVAVGSSRTPITWNIATLGTGFAAGWLVVHKIATIRGIFHPELITIPAGGIGLAFQKSNGEKVESKNAT